MDGKARQRCAELNRWVTECLSGLGVAAKPWPVTAPWEPTWYKQAVTFERRDVERSDRHELQDCILAAVKKALVYGIGGVKSRNGDPSWGWKVLGTKNLSEDQSVDNLGVRLWEPSMPHYATWIVWQGPKPETWPHMMHLGQAENALSYPVGHAPTWS